MLARLHRADIIRDVFGGAKPVRTALQRFKAEGRGVLVYLRDGAAGVPVHGDSASGRRPARRRRAASNGARSGSARRSCGISASPRSGCWPRDSMTYVGLSGFGIEIVSTEPIEV